MARKRGEALAQLPAQVHPEQRLTAAQAMQLSGRGRTKFYLDIKDGRLPAPCEKSGRFVRWRAADVINALNGGR